MERRTVPVVNLTFYDLFIVGRDSTAGLGTVWVSVGGEFASVVIIKIDRPRCTVDVSSS